MGKTDWEALLPDPVVPSGLDSEAQHGNEQPKQLDVNNWLWQLDQIQQGMQKLCRDINVAISVEFMRDDLGNNWLKPGETGIFHGSGLGNEQRKTFPLGTYLCYDAFSENAYKEYQSGELWLELGGSNLPRYVHWDSFTLHDSLPAAGSPFLLTGGIEWKVWHYVKESRNASIWHEQREEWDRVQAAALAACESAPPAVINRIGNTSGFGDWPSSLFYFSLKKIHPLLTAWGIMCRGYYEPLEQNVKSGLAGRRGCKNPTSQSITDANFGACNDYLLTISPSSVLTATEYVLEAFRQMASAPAGDDASVDCYVTLQQAAAIVNRSKRTLEKYKVEMPAPRVSDGGGKPDEWAWSELRPWLKEYSGRELPARFPTDQFRKD